MFTKQSTQRLTEEFKLAFHEAITFAGEKQETLAMHIGVSQGQVNNWCNINSDRQFPMALLPVLPARMQNFLMDHVNKQCNTDKSYTGLDGSVNDEILMLLTLESDLKKQSETDPRKARKTILMMREILNRADQEVNTMAEAK